ncbi:NUDIX hydrolase domain-like protein [Camillea tinctor]|nr:NUDIX hydrolase domain-like protein [Camillea tinctor]
MDCPWDRVLYSSGEFVEACGAIVFSDNNTVCLIHHSGDEEWLLPKGRRNCGETRHAAALREVREETGCNIMLTPLRLSTRAPHSTDPPDVPDAAREYDDLTEPFMLDWRDLKGRSPGGVKLVWWFVARFQNMSGTGEEQYEVKFVQCDQAVDLLTFQKDKNVLAKAIEVMGKQQRGNVMEAMNGNGVKNGVKNGSG